jgi:hypothetical protein
VYIRLGMVAGKARSHGKCRVSGLALFIALAALSWAASPAPPAIGAAAPYEPNDSLPAAAGPLTAGSLYSAGLETASDRDFFFFYVTSPGAARVELGVHNLGSSKASGIDVTIFDVSATAIAAQTFIRGGESTVLPAELEPQKYFAEVSSSEGSGDSYSLTAGGSPGAFGPYSQIAERCTSARAAVARSAVGLSRAKSKLQRTTARLRRSRYAQPSARRRAQAEHDKAKHRVSAQRRALDAARKGRWPWCSIAP